MPAWLSAATSAVTRLNRAIFYLTVWLMAIVVPVMLYEVVRRYVFNDPTVWAMELAVLLFGPYFLLFCCFFVFLFFSLTHTFFH